MECREEPAPIIPEVLGLISDMSQLGLGKIPWEGRCNQSVQSRKRGSDSL